MELWIVGWMVSKDVQINENYTRITVFNNYEKALQEFNYLCEDLKEMYPDGVVIEKNKEKEKTVSVDAECSYDVIVLKRGEFGEPVYIEEEC